ncbi:MAG: helix-turn-helix transcriptional regulator [Myxococcota bacterium]|jgi:DNA-binding XRE family transcriptional regulator|nr:helix-turn-helix transcriptional regulator [Myxococcota bacterium]
MSPAHPTPTTSTTWPTPTPTPEQVLWTVQRLDREARTGGRLPLARLRPEFPGLTRADLDGLLRELAAAGRLRLAPPLDPRRHTPAELEAGIPGGGALVYVFACILQPLPAAPPVWTPPPPEADPEPDLETEPPAATPSPSSPSSPARSPRRSATRRPDPEPPTAIRLLRDALGISQARLAALVGCQRLAVVRWEAGRPLGRPPLLLIAALEAFALGCLPRPAAGERRWSWHAALFAALDAATIDADRPGR